MTLNLKKPIVFFDLETTGTDICKDRIVEVCFLKVMPSGEEIVKTLKINPTIPIPIESSLIHGIYDADVADAPTFAQKAAWVFDFIKGCDLGGYNLIKFDIPLLAEEFMRVNIDFSMDGRCVVDACKLFHLMEPRSLTAAYKFYCGKSLEKAHSAEADTIASYEVLKAQVERYENVSITAKDHSEQFPVKNDMAVLHATTFQNQADLAGQLMINSAGKEIFNFGKHKNKLVEDILRTEPSYYDWMMKSDFPLYTKKVMTRIRLRMMQTA